jgi:hypothetical protein
MANYDWTDEVMPYTIDSPKYVFPPARPTTCVCCRATNGKNPVAIAPHTLTEACRFARKIQNDKSVSCLLLALSKDFLKLNFSVQQLLEVQKDVIEWSEHIATLTDKPVHLLLKGRFPCGDKPLCEQNPRSMVEEGLDAVEHMLENVHQIDEFINKNFAFLSPRDRAILHTWATNKDLDNKTDYMTDEAIAKKFGVTAKTVRRVRTKAKEGNPNAFKTLMVARTRLKQTHGYNVSEA